jgi:hypothetical protein
MAPRWLLLLAVTACNFTHGAASGGGGSDGSGSNSGSDARMIDSPPQNPLCFGPMPYQACVSSTPVGNMMITNDLNTDGNVGDPCGDGGTVVTMSNAAQTSVCLMAADRYTLPQGSKIQVTGANPLFIIGATSITIVDTLDASSRSQQNQQTGANADAVCTPVDGTADGGGGGGGAGGSFGSVGGSGSQGNLNAGGAGGNALLMPTVSTLEGGCAGGKGGDGSSATGGAGGDSGGAIELATHGTITISGSVNASGAAGGAGNKSKSGGGGGGSGGMIVLVAQTYNVSGIVYANGGGGGGGATNGGAGMAGNDVTYYGTAALGGAGASGIAGAGGQGAVSNFPAGGGVTSAGGEGGGGGGGGVGIFHAFGGSFPTGHSSPPAT